MQKPPLQLKDHIFKKIHVDAKDISLAVDGVSEKIPFGYNFDFTTEAFIVEGDTRLFRVELNIKTREKKDCIQGYVVDLTVAGLFIVENNFPEEKRPELLSIMGPTLLYGAAREFLYGLTSRGPFDAIYLPTVSFLPDKKESKEKISSYSDTKATKRKVTSRKKVPSKKPASRKK